MTERAIFLQALELNNPSERSDYLERVCRTRPGLRTQVESLLRLQEQQDSFLDRPAADRLAGLELNSDETSAACHQIAHLMSDSPSCQDMIGPYRLVRQLGEGGFGVVYLAEQTVPVRRQVALKLLKFGTGSRQVVARFEAERQALALMDHPNVATVFDGGTTASGQPYFVMELINGTPITEYCDNKKIPLPGRLELFMQVCQAVQHAHTKGIIHRDLKPSNVFTTHVDGKPVIKVIDFGVAKAVGQDLTDKTLMTAQAQLIGTPLYMSPEQAGMSDLDVDTRSDIYSLSVLLYELLTGSTPFSSERLKRLSYDDLRRVIRDEEPPRPSERLLTSSLLPSIAADRGLSLTDLSRSVRELDWIVMKGLEKDRERRYETATGFAADVGRYLSGQAVLAVPPSVSYRVRKFVRRNRRALLTGGALAVVLLVAVGGVAGSIGWATRDRAAHQASVESEANRAFDEADRWMDLERWTDAHDAAKRGQAVLAGGGSDEIRGRMRTLLSDAEMMIRLDNIRLSVTDLKQNWHEWAAHDEGYRKTFATYGFDFDALTAEEAAARILARGRRARPLAAALELWASSEQAKSKDDRTRMRDIAGIVDPDPWRQSLRDGLLRRDGRALKALADSPEANRQTRDSLYILHHGLKHSGEPGKSVEILRLMQSQHPADFWANYWIAHELYWSAKPDHHEVVSFARTASALRPTSAAAHLLLALALQRTGKLDQALYHNDRSIELAPENPYAHHDRGWTLRLQGRFEDSLACYSKAIDLWPENPHAYGFRGHTLKAMNRLDEAIVAFRLSCKYQPMSAGAHMALAQALHDKGYYDEALQVCLHTARTLDTSSDAAEKLCHEVFAHKPHSEAAAYLVDVAKQDGAPSWLYFHIAVTLRNRGHYETSLGIFDKSYAANPTNSHALHNKGGALRELGRYEEAIEHFQQALDIDPTSRWAMHGLGQTLRKQGDLKGAIAKFRKVIEIDPKNVEFQLSLSECLLELGEHKEASQAARRAAVLALHTQGLKPQIGDSFARIARHFADASSPGVRDPAMAVELARQATAIKPAVATWRVAGLANYRAGSHVTAIEAFEASLKLANGGSAYDWFFLAMSHWRLGDHVAARQWYDKALASQPPNVADAALRAVRDEATGLIAAPPPGEASSISPPD